MSGSPLTETATTRKAKDLTGRINKYLKLYGAGEKWRLVAPRLDKIENAVVIPALAESDNLFKTLACLSRNDPELLKKTLVICVINNRTPDQADRTDIEDNRTTVEILGRLVGKAPAASDGPEIMEILQNGLSVGYIDASSPGFELPLKRGGVGLARKIGMDAALGILDCSDAAAGLIFSLDADTLVDPDYLSAVRGAFEAKGLNAAVIEFSHRPGKSDREDDAISWYETFIRYYAMGLDYAGSPYAYHSIGSTIVATAEAYLSVRGMKIRDAGEDFYFLNKLAKAAPIGRIHDTTVYPSSRVSLRVPFGTGKTMARFGESRPLKYNAYDPAVFEILKRWLDCLRHHAPETEERLLERAGAVHGALREYLIREGFEGLWPKLRRNSAGRGVMVRHAFAWFDALKTFKMIRYMTEHAYPTVDMYPAIKKIMIMKGIGPPEALDGAPIPSREVRKTVLDFLRKPHACGGPPETASRYGKSRKILHINR